MSDIWLMTFEEFNAKYRTVNSKQYADDYFRLNIRHCIGCHYYLYVSSDLEIIKPHTKKDKNKKCIKSFVSTGSALDVKEQAYLFILEYAKKEGLFEVSVCNLEITKRQLNYIKTWKERQ
jgi:hypothetical protein